VCINITDAHAVKLISIDELQNLFVRGEARLRQVLQSAYDKIALPEIPQRKLTDDEGMRENDAEIEEVHERLVRSVQMMHPDRNVDQDHPRFDRRLEGMLRLGSLPPKRASRRALSLSIKALSASRTNADFSRSPVKAWALANNSSSSASVVRIIASIRCQNYHHLMSISMPLGHDQCICASERSRHNHAQTARPSPVTDPRYRLSQRRMKPSSPWGMKMIMAMKMMPTGMR
jgi:hypothetical protein